MKNMYAKSFDDLKALYGRTLHKILVTAALSIAAVILTSSGGFAQDVQTVRGKVTSSGDNAAIPGVNVVVKGTNTGTTTDINGDFSVRVKPEDILVISFIGYHTEEIEVGNRSQINVALIEEVTQLSEIVVVGYGEMKRSDLTGSVVSVSGETLNNTIATGVDQALIGRVAGVTAVQMSGQPGSSVSIRVRGASSINGDVEPLYVIDGVPVSGNNGTVYDYGLGAVGGAGRTTFSPLSGINPNDIESLEVLKDASATAIYGNRGSNGVVIITTKRGKTGQTRISYDGYYGVQELPKRLDLMNLREYAEYRNDFAAETAGEIPDPKFADPSLLGEGTDWQEAIFRTATIQSHQITFSGGVDKLRYALSGGYFDQEGTAVGSNFDRYSIRLNLDSDIRDWLTIGNSLSLSRTSERLGKFDRDGIINTALKARPDVPERNFDGSFSGGDGEGSVVSPLAQALDIENYLKRTQILGNLYASIKLLPSLTFRTEYGGNVDLSNASTWTPTYDYGGGAVNTVNSINKQNNVNYFWQFKNYLTFNKTLAGSHTVTAMIGQEASEWGWNNINAGSTGLPTNNVQSIGLGATLGRNAGDSKGSGAISSYFGRLNYNFGDKYYLTFTYRADGSSNFAEGNKWGYFPSAAVSWRVSEEPFMAGLNSYVSNLKIRVGWGQTGNSGGDGYLYGSRLATLPTGLGLGFRVANHANPDLTWETAEQIDLGVDAGILDNRIQITVDFYRKRVKDLLLQQPLPSYLGSLGNDAIKLNAPWGNFGEIENKGFELELKTINLSGAFQWETDLNITRNINKLIDLGIKDAALDGLAQWTTLVSRTTNGLPLYEYFGYEVEGVFKDKEDILNSPVQWDPTEVDGDGNPIFSRDGSVWPGDLKFRDIDGNDTIDVRDRTYLGNPQPKFTYGFNNTFRYKGFELEIFMVASYGNKVYNFNKQGEGGGIADMRSAWNNQLKEVTNRAKLEPVAEAVDGWWDDIDNVQVANPDTNIPRASFTDPNQNARVSDRYIEDGSYLRIRNITLGYNLPASIIEKINFSKLKIYGRIQNAYTWTKYTGFDPEIGQDTWNTNVFGVDNGRYPSPRIYTFGISADF